jgi:hypothetical protein
LGFRHGSLRISLRNQHAFYTDFHEVGCEKSRRRIQTKFVTYG